MKDDHELLDVVDAHGEPTGETVERSRAHAEGIPHRTSHVWLVRQRGGRTELLLQKRCETKSSFPGCYDISSAGHIPAGGGFRVSAIRELKEELGVDASPEELLYCGDRTVSRDECFFGRPFHDRQFSRVFVLWRDQDESAFVPQKEEVSEVRWMALDECIEAVRGDTIPNCMSLDELYMVRSAVGRSADPMREQNGERS